MGSKSIENLLVRASLLAGILALALAFAEGFAQLIGTSLVSYLYAPSRILEIGAVLFVCAIALLIKQIRDQLAARGD